MIERTNGANPVEIHFAKIKQFHSKLTHPQKKITKTELQEFHEAIKKANEELKNVKLTAKVAPDIKAKTIEESKSLRATLSKPQQKSNLESVAQGIPGPIIHELKASEELLSKELGPSEGVKTQGSEVREKVSSYSGDRTPVKSREKVVEGREKVTERTNGGAPFETHLNNIEQFHKKLNQPQPKITKAELQEIHAVVKKIIEDLHNTKLTAKIEPGIRARLIEAIKNLRVTLDKQKSMLESAASGVPGPIIQELKGIEELLSQDIEKKKRSVSGVEGADFGSGAP